MAASPRYTTLLLVTLLVILNFSHAAKEAAGLRNQAVQDNHGEVDEEAMGFTAADERCGGAGGEGEEECLMRRTLVAHTDYIYTQGSHN